nr:hypothetical protein [Bradyrhizobium elkanii]
MVRRWFDDERDRSPFLVALNELRHKATREGWCYAHVQAIIVAIDQYAETATGNRDYFLNKPVSIGGSRTTREAL